MILLRRIRVPGRDQSRRRVPPWHRASFVPAMVVCMVAACAVSDQPIRDSASGLNSTHAVDPFARAAAVADNLLESLRNNIDGMNSMNAAYVAANLPSHLQAVGDALDQMAADQASLRLRPSVRWRALEDSVRLDLRRMNNMRLARIRLEMRPHGARVVRLIELHRLRILQHER